MGLGSKRLSALLVVVLAEFQVLLLSGLAPTPGDAPQAPVAGARSDTLFLFAAEGPGSYGSPGTDARGFTFDGPTGEAEPAGWHGVDRSDEGVHWQLASTSICAGTDTDLSEALPFDPGDAENDFALWCGDDNPCWANTPGYGNRWDQLAVLDLAGHPLSDSLRLDFAYRSDFEGEQYDAFRVFTRYDDDPLHWDVVFVENTAQGQTYREFSVTIPVFEFGDQADHPQVAFRFTSDRGWSDEDGIYLSDVGAVWLDNLRASVDGVEVFAADFEDGLVPPQLSLIAYPAAGDYAGLYQRLYQGNADPVNQSYAWACFDSLTPSYNAPGYDFAIAWGPPYVDNAIESPALSVDDTGQPLALGSDTRVLLQADVYRDLGPDRGASRGCWGRILECGSHRCSPWGVGWSRAMGLRHCSTAQPVALLRRRAPDAGG